MWNKAVVLYKQDNTENYTLDIFGLVETSPVPSVSHRHFASRFLALGTGCNL